jgi:hypothetical protein
MSSGFPTSHQVVDTFASIPFLITLSDSYRTGPADFSCLTGFRFVLIIADNFSASSCPINRAGKSAYFLRQSLSSFSCELKFRFCLSGQT